MGHRNNLDECHSVTVAIATENRLDSPNSTTSTYIKQFKSSEFTNNNNNMKNNRHLIRAINIELKKTKTLETKCAVYMIDIHIYLFFALPKCARTQCLALFSHCFPSIYSLAVCFLFVMFKFFRGQRFIVFISHFVRIIVCLCLYSHGT